MSSVADAASAAQIAITADNPPPPRGPDRAGVDIHDQLHVLGRGRLELWCESDDHDPAR